ncbi:MAG: PH domain-containing protein [Enterococcus sp.]
MSTDYLQRNQDGGMEVKYPLLSRHLPQRIKRVWRNSNWIYLIFVGIIGGGVSLGLHMLDLLNGWLLGSSIGYFLLIFIVCVISHLLIDYRYNFNRYAINSEELAFQKGYIFRKTTYVPINRIQHVETEQGPLLRREGLMALVIHTAATSHRLEGLEILEATELRQQIIDMVKVAKDDV